jgi:sugar phosphate isomerase/epimerase
MIKTYDPIRSAGDFRRLKEKIPNVRLCIDVEHAIIRKEYPEFIHGCCSDIGHIHMCGFTGGPHHRPVYENMPLMVEIVTMLKECDYQGFIVCEHDVEFHTIEIWKKTLEECSPLFGE